MQKNTMFLKLVFVPVLTLFMSGVCSIAPTRAEEEVDLLCQLLFRQYIVGARKVETASVMAASHLIVSRGRNTGFWKTVLAKLKEDDKRSEIGCVGILGRMLQIDARARETLKRYRETGEIGQWRPSVCLAPEVLDELLARAEKAGRHRAHHYTIALARARDRRAKDFFLRAIRNEDGKNYAAGTQFHAALGLAELGNPSGFQWLIAHTEDVLPTVSGAWPAGAPDHNLGTCSVWALRALSGQHDVATRSEWEAWWESARKPFSPKSYVDIVEQ